MPGKYFNSYFLNKEGEWRETWYTRKQIEESEKKRKARYSYEKKGWPNPSQTGNPKGTYSYCDPHPFLEDRYFRNYEKITLVSGRQKYRESWLTKEGMESNKRIQRENMAQWRKNNLERYLKYQKEYSKRRRPKVGA